MAGREARRSIRSDAFKWSEPRLCFLAVGVELRGHKDSLNNILNI
jgi:hypothetical protein